MTRDGILLLASRALRMFSIGFLSVVIALYLAGAGYSPAAIGLLFSVTLAGGTAATVLASLLVDRWGRRRVLILLALLSSATGVALAGPSSPALLLALAAFGTLSPTGSETGPFQALEQTALSHTGREDSHVTVYAWYNLAGSLSGALGALAAGAVPAALGALGWSPLAAQRALIWASAGIGILLAGLYAALSPAIEIGIHRDPDAAVIRPGLGRSRRIVLGLSGLFAVDSFAGGFVVQSLMALWFRERFGLGLEVLGPLFFGTNLLSALSYLVAARLAARFGLLNTMVFTHIPSDVLLGLVPLMPTAPLAAGVLLMRHALAQMDVPARQAYTMAVVAPEERSAAAGFTNAVRPAAASLGPALAGASLQAAASGLPFFVAGGLKIVYDLTLWATFRRVPIAGGSARAG